MAGLRRAGKPIAPTDLLEISIGGNDARAYYQSGGSLAGAPAAASASVAQAMAGVNALVGAGARNIVFTVGDVSTLPEAVGVPGRRDRHGIQPDLQSADPNDPGAFARGGVRVEYVDISLIGARSRPTRRAIGITNTGACPMTCVGNPALQKQYLFYVDGFT